MEATARLIKVLVVVDGVGEASFYLKASRDNGTDVEVSINPQLRPNAIMGVLLLAVDSAMVHTRNNGELEDHWVNFQPMVRDVLELNELILGVQVELERWEEAGRPQ